MMRIVRWAIVGACMAIATSAGAQTKLYTGEEAVTAAGFPAVAYFRKGDPAKPLVVFSPGAHHMARIAYGGHPGARREDFLDYWLAQQGYSFLAVSYPIDTPAFAEKRPEFTARDWGKQLIEIARAKIRQNGLSDKLVVALWSMGGKAVQPSYAAARDAGLDVETTISFAATPGIPGLISYTTRIDMAPSGYASRTALYAGWLKQLADNAKDNGGRAIIPEEIFRTEYVGDMSVNLQGYGEVYREGKFELDHMAQATDYGAFNFDAYPLVTVFEDEDVADARHALADRANWTIYNVNTVVNRYIAGNKINLGELGDERWKKLVALTRDLDDRLSIAVGGNHFFFVGERGAKRTAAAIDESIARTRAVKAELEQILKVPLD